MLGNSRLRKIRLVKKKKKVHELVIWVGLKKEGKIYQEPLGC